MVKKITRSGEGLYVGDVLEDSVRGRGVVDEIYPGAPIQAFVVWDDDRSSSLVNVRDIQRPNKVI